MAKSLAEQVAALPEAERQQFFASLSPQELDRLPYHWPFWARPSQMPPPNLSDYRVWLVMSGRGAGKTRLACEWVRSEIETGRRKHVGLFGTTHSDVTETMLYGPSGLMTVCPPWFRPEYNSQKHRLTWPNGAITRLFSAETPEVRGPNFDAVWMDELASWQYAQETYDMAQFGLRLDGPTGLPPVALVTTTPRPTKIMKEIVASPDTYIVRESTFDNAANLSPQALKYYRDRYESTSLGRQELFGALVTDVEGALWNRAMLDACRVKAAPEYLKRVVVAIDPSGGAGRSNDETGIAVCAVGGDGKGYVLADLSGRYSPNEWARRAVDAYKLHKADRIICESNFGGQMVVNTITTVAPFVPVKMVHASRGKAVRAEPILSLYEQHRIHHVGLFEALEDQMCSWVPGEGSSPDRIDAVVWAFTELLVTNARPAYRMNFDFMSR